MAGTNSEFKLQNNKSFKFSRSLGDPICHQVARSGKVHIIHCMSENERERGGGVFNNSLKVLPTTAHVDTVIYFL